VGRRASPLHVNVSAAAYKLRLALEAVHLLRDGIQLAEDGVNALIK
jgi:hypothetical protein